MNILEFRKKLKTSANIENTNIDEVLFWLEKKRAGLRFEAKLISLNNLLNWNIDRNGNIFHQSGSFFSVQGVRTTAGNLREVSSWDQPIFNQKEGGILALLCREKNNEINFLIQAKAEPGNIGKLQLVPTIQATQSNLKQEHKGKMPVFSEELLNKNNIQIYSAKHNEEGGRFWQKSNENKIIMVDSQHLKFNNDLFIWLSLSQIKNLALVDNILSPFVKTIIAPL